MNKRYLLIGGLLAVSVTACAFALAGCNQTPEEQVPEIKETVRYSEKTNPYAELTWQEIKGIDDWSDKILNSPVYYQFEGSYSEAYQGNYSRTYMYMNCYEDGSMHATYGNANYYGFWTNVDASGKENLILHILRVNDQEYNHGNYKSVCEAQTGDFYEYQVPVYVLDNGGRTAFINGYHYSPVESITVENAPDKYILNDKFSTEGMKVNVIRENGKSMAIDKDSYGKSDCRVQFSGFDSSKKGEGEITVKYINTDITATYPYTVMGIKAVDFNVEDANKEYYVGDRFDNNGIVVTATRDDDGVAEIPSSRWTVEGFDSTSITDKQTLTVRFGEYTYNYDISILPLEFDGQINGKDVTIKYLSTTVCALYGDGYPTEGYQFGYGANKITAGDLDIITLTKPEDSEMPDAEWEALPKTYGLDKSRSSFEVYDASENSKYEIPWDGDNRNKYEPMPGIGGGTTYRYISLLSDDTAILSYRYYYDKQIDTFVVKYTRVGNEITFTECLGSSIGDSGKNYDGLQKVWTLNDDKTATR